MIDFYNFKSLPDGLILNAQMMAVSVSILMDTTSLIFRHSKNSVFKKIYPIDNIVDVA